MGTPDHPSSSNARRRRSRWGTALQPRDDAGPGSPSSEGTAGARGLSGQNDHYSVDSSTAKSSLHSPHMMRRRASVLGDTRMTAAGVHLHWALT